MYIHLHLTLAFCLNISVLLFGIRHTKPWFKLLMSSDFPQTSII